MIALWMLNLAVWMQEKKPLDPGNLAMETGGTMGWSFLVAKIGAEVMITLDKLGTCTNVATALIS